MLKSKIREIGNSNGIIIPKAIMDHLGWEPNDELEIRIKDDRLILRRVNEKAR